METFITQDVLISMNAKKGLIGARLIPCAKTRPAATHATVIGDSLVMENESVTMLMNVKTNTNVGTTRVARTLLGVTNARVNKVTK